MLVSKHNLALIAASLMLAVNNPATAVQAGEATAERPETRQKAHTHHPDDDLDWLPCPDFMPDGCGIAVLQGKPDENNADVFFRMAADTVVPGHWHTSAERMVLVAGEMVVDYEGQDPVRLTPGAYAYGPAGLPHETHCTSEEGCVLFIAFEEPVDAHPHD